MAWIAVDEKGHECVYSHKPERSPMGMIFVPTFGDVVLLPKGASKSLTGKQMTWDDEPIELK